MTSTVQFWAQLRDALKGTGGYDDPLSDLTWEQWLRRMLAGTRMLDFGDHHAEAWDHVWPIELDDSPDALLMPYPRKGGKSTSAEWMMWATILRGQRRYWLEVCDTQDQADDHVATISSLFERRTVEIYYPQHAQRRLSKYGQSKGWRRNRLVTAGGGIIDALGLDTARGRGIKFEELVPDAVCLDDCDHKFDSPRLTKKKELTIQETILPALQPNALVLFAQNLVIPHGLMSRLVHEEASYLFNRKTIGPVPAIEDIETETRYDEEKERNRVIITGGTATWDGLSIEKCQQLIDRNGWQSFNTEQQNNVEEREGALWTKALLNDTRTDRANLPRDSENRIVWKRVVVGVDPSGGGDDIGIIVGALGHNGHGYVLLDATQPGSKGPNNWAWHSVKSFDEYRADTIAAERNFGGDMVKSTIQSVSKNVPVKVLTASRGKAIRAEPIVRLYEEDLIHHVGSFPDLEAELTSWIPGESTESPNRLDALVWTFTELMLEEEQVYYGGMGSYQVG